MLHANLLYNQTPPTEFEKLNYLIKAHIEERRFLVKRIGPKANEELRSLGYRIMYHPTTDSYEISW